MGYKFKLVQKVKRYPRGSMRCSICYRSFVDEPFIILTVENPFSNRYVATYCRECMEVEE